LRGSSGDAPFDRPGEIVELLLLLYAMLAGLAGLSGQGPARAHEVALGSTTAVETTDCGVRTAVAAQATVSARAGRVLDALRIDRDARLDDVALTVLALVPLSRQAPERRLE
jgi:hypothetical protein